jgi:hypothetical protein
MIELNPWLRLFIHSALTVLLFTNLSNHFFFKTLQAPRYLEVVVFFVLLSSFLKGKYSITQLTLYLLAIFLICLVFERYVVLGIPYVFIMKRLQKKSVNQHNKELEFIGSSHWQVRRALKTGLKSSTFDLYYTILVCVTLWLMMWIK